MDLAHESKPKEINIDILYLRQSKSILSQPEYDAAVIRCGPSGMLIVERASAFGIRGCCVDPDPLLGWPNNYRLLVDEFEETGLASCFYYTWSLANVAIDEVRWKGLNYPNGRVCRWKLMEGCAGNGVSFCKASLECGACASVDGLD